jgi:hypothetical protein
MLERLLGVRSGPIPLTTPTRVSRGPRCAAQANAQEPPPDTQNREPLEAHDLGDAGDITGIVHQGSPGTAIGPPIPGTVNSDQANPSPRRRLRHGGIHEPGPGHAVKRDDRESLSGAEHGHAYPPTITKDQDVRVRCSSLGLLSGRHRATPPAPGQRSEELMVDHYDATSGAPWAEL